MQKFPEKKLLSFFLSRETKKRFAWNSEMVWEN